MRSMASRFSRCNVLKKSAALAARGTAIPILSRDRRALASRVVLVSWLTCLSSSSMAVEKPLLQQYDFDEYSRRPISFYYCQAGFATDGYKPIYIWTRNEYPAGKAVLRDCNTGKTVPVPLASKGVNIWGRQDWIADCSGVTAEGNYVLQAEFGGQSAETAPFSISKNCYEDLREKTAKHFFLKRCGVFCHTHDGYLYSLKPNDFGKVLGEVPAYGGWHDAHDDDKWMPYVWQAVYGLLKIQERFGPKWRGSNEPYPYCLAEAWWEVDWLLRMQKPDGTFYYAVTEWFPNLARKQGDRMVLQLFPLKEHNYDDLHDDRRAVLDTWGEYEASKTLSLGSNQAPSTGPKYFAYCAHALRYCGRLIKPYDRKNAERCITAARKTIDYVEQLDHYAPYQELEVHAGLALYWLEEARDGGGPAALAKAEGYLKKMLAMQQPEGHFHASRTCRGLEFYPEEAGDEAPLLIYPFGYMLALTEYLEYSQQDKEKACVLVDDVKNSYVRFARMLEKFCNATVFRQPSEPRFDRQPAVIIPWRPNLTIGYNSYILSAGFVFAAAERLAGFQGGQELAQHQLHWLFGANPRFMSFMNQVGVRNSGQYAASSSVTSQYYSMGFFRHLRDMRWGVTTGLYGPRDQLANYPNAGKSMYGAFDSTAQETWVTASGCLLLLLSEFER